MLPEEEKARGGFLGEAPSSPDRNRGEFEALAQRGEVMAVFSGHDHNNSFVLPHRGIDLGYTQGAGFNAYGPGKNRGVRILTFREEDPRAYETHTCTYRDLFGSRPLQDPGKELLYRCAPTGLRAAKSDLKKAGKAAAVAAAAYGVYRIIQDDK